MSEPKHSGFLGRFALRVRHKLAISLSIAALLPVLVASWVAVSVVFRSLGRNIVEDADRQLHVGLNLLLRNVQRVGQVSVQLAGAPALASSLSNGELEVASALDGERTRLPSSLVQVANASGQIVEESVIGWGSGRFSGLGIAEGDSNLRLALEFERRVTLERRGGLLVVRAVAPVVDESFKLLGAVVISVPLDSFFADSLKSALGADVLILADADAPEGAAVSSSFLDPVGARVRGVRAPPAIGRLIRSGEPAFVEQIVAEREYTVGYAPLVNKEGSPIGVFGVAVGRAPLVSARAAAMRSLALGAAGAFVFALGLAGLLSRRITKPVARLHEGAIAIARGDLNYAIDVEEGDEIGDLAAAFANMTSALKENQARLAARMREIVALNDAGRAVASVIDLDQVLRVIVDQVARVLNARVCAIWLRDPGDGSLVLGAARAKASDLRTTISGDAGVAMVIPLHAVAVRVAELKEVLHLDGVGGSAFEDAARAAGVTGSLMAIPLEQKGIASGVIVVGRLAESRPFSDADSNLFATFAGQAAAAVENGRLYEEVRAFNEELEAKVRQRTLELTKTNAALSSTITELSETQAQLVLSERLAGLGQLVAGVAHEINSPTAAIAGSIEPLSANVERLSAYSHRLSEVPMESGDWASYFELLERAASAAPDRQVTSPVVVRRTARELSSRLMDLGVGDKVAAEVARGLAELVPDRALLDDLATAIVGDASSDERARVLIGYVREYVYLHRSVSTISSAVRRIKRIVGGLKKYSHLDQDVQADANLHEGIENTLVILEHSISAGVEIQKRYGDIPPIPVYVDELNQVWTNLIHNAIQAVAGSGTICIESETDGDYVVVRIIDDGAGIPDEALDRIFEPFYTTKPKGEGTGLGLRIVKQIIEKHRGTVVASSEPGRTCFEVRIPVKPSTEGSVG